MTNHFLRAGYLSGPGQTTNDTEKEKWERSS